jgi:hypothetical protein
MRAVHLALYADSLAANASALSAQLERARDRLRQAAIEREARRSLDPPTVARLERLGVLADAGTRGDRAAVAELSADLAALEVLQVWVEAQLFRAREDGSPILDGSFAEPG